MSEILPESEYARLVAHNLPTMLAYWDARETCRFANQSYQVWFGKSPSDMLGITMRQLLGPLYELNLPYIQGALSGIPQVFERRIPLPDGNGHRDSLATYTPDIVNGIVRGFVVQVSDISFVKHGLSTAAAQRVGVEGRPGSELQTMCAWCKRVLDRDRWISLEEFVCSKTGVLFTHGMCHPCLEKMQKPGGAKRPL